MKSERLLALWLAEFAGEPELREALADADYAFRLIESAPTGMRYAGGEFG